MSLKPPMDPNTQRGTSRRALIGAAGVALAAGAGLAWWQQTSRRGEGSEVGDGLADFWQTSMPKPGGGELAMATFRPTGLVLNFWASWCAPCVREFPELDRFHQSAKSRGWRVLGLAADTMPAVSGFLAKHPVSFDIVVSSIEGLNWSRRLGNDVGGLPFTVIFNPGGAVRSTIRGETSYDKLMQATGL
jgi:thiol-disulfide isomerase/thioredoxin